MKREKLIMTIVIGIVCFLLIMIMFMQFKVVQQTNDTDIDAMQETELRSELTKWKTRYDESKTKYDETLEMISKYKEESTNAGETKRALEEELKVLDIALGKIAVEGEGVVITLTEKKDEEMDEEEKLNFASIEASDLIKIVNYLKDSGAEAISINDERIINTTDFVDVGGAIKINSKYLRASTYVIKAIGNGSYLESSIFGKGGYAEQLEITGIRATIDKQNKVEISKYDGDFEVRYMEGD